MGFFEATDEGSYPGKDYFREQAHHNCGPNYTFSLQPLGEGWELGDRQVTCLQNSFGLSVTDPLKLDRLVNRSSVRKGSCINHAPETGGSQVELVDCSGTWEMRLLSRFVVSNNGEYPGENWFRRQAVDNCERRRTNWLYPLQDSWSAGDRTVECVQENLTGERGISSILDSLVDPFLLNPNECFNLYETPTMLSSELTPCAGEWQFQATQKGKITDGEYPGEEYIAERIQELCGPESPNQFRPERITWELGYRNIICLETKGSDTPQAFEENTQYEDAMDRGIALYDGGQYEAALREFQRAQEIYGSTSEDAETWMGLTQEELENYPAAIQHYSNAIRINDSGWNRTRRAYAYLWNGNLEAAKTDARAALEKPAESYEGSDIEVEANWTLALVQEELGNYEEALRHATRARTGAAVNGYSSEELSFLDDLTARITKKAENRRFAAPTPDPLSLPRKPQTTNGDWVYFGPECPSGYGNCASITSEDVNFITLEAYEDGGRPIHKRADIRISCWEGSPNFTFTGDARHRSLRKEQS